MTDRPRFTHAQLAEYFSRRLRWRDEAQRLAYADGLVKALDARRCHCPRPPSCEQARPPANLIAVGDAKVCPELLGDVAGYGIRHQSLAPAAPVSEHGLVVTDVARWA